MVYLSRADIETIGTQIIQQYKSETIPVKHMCYRVDPLELASVLGLTVDFQYLSHDGQILGVTSPDQICVSTYIPQYGDMLYYLDGDTILIEKRLQNTPKLVGRMNFTIAHEIAHQILYRHYPGVYGPDHRVLCDYRRTPNKHAAISDWHEWQADALAAVILLPADAIIDGMFMFDLGKKMKVLSKKYSYYKYECFCALAEYLQVSKSTLSYRMEYLGLLERNCLFSDKG